MKKVSVEEIIKKAEELPIKKWKNEGNLNNCYEYSARVGFGKKILVRHTYDFNPHYTDNFYLEITSFGKKIFKIEDRGIISPIYNKILRNTGSGIFK